MCYAPLQSHYDLPPAFPGLFGMSASMPSYCNDRPGSYTVRKGFVSAQSCRDTVADKRAIGAHCKLTLVKPIHHSA